MTDRRRNLSSFEKEQRFNRNRKVLNRFIRGFLAKNKVGIVHGTRATNAQLPRFLMRETTDWDVFVEKPRKRATQLEKKLDKRYRGDFFYVKKGTGSPGVKVFKVASNVTGESFVDFATPKRNIPSTPRRGVRFATLADQKRAAQINVRKKELEFRRAKDKNLLMRIKKFEKLRGGKKV